MYILQLSCESKSEWLLSDSSVGVELSESEDDSSWMRLQHARQLADISWGLAVHGKAMYILQLSCESKSEWLLSDSSVGVELSGSKDDSSWMRLQHAR